MIRVKLIDHRLGAKYVDFRAVPLVDPVDYRCHPRDLLTFEDAVDLSRQLDCGDVEGYLRHYQWYRQALSREEWEEAANVWQKDIEACYPHCQSMACRGCELPSAETTTLAKSIGNDRAKAVTRANPSS